MMQMIQENALLIITAFGSVNLIQAAAMVIKAFSQKKMNKSFDLFNNGARSLVDGSTKVNLQIDGFKKAITEVEQLIKEVKYVTEQLNKDNVLEALSNSLKELQTVKMALKYKDDAIEAYARDMNAIRIALNELGGRGGYDDILQVEQKTQKDVYIQPTLSIFNDDDSTDSVVTSKQD